MSDVDYMLSDDDFQIDSEDDLAFDEDESDFESSPIKSKSKSKPKATKAKGKAPSKAKKLKQTTLLLVDSDVDDDDDDVGMEKNVPVLAERSINVDSSNEKAKSPVKATKKKGKKKTVEETYQKMTQLEHILKRPDTYIGSIERVTEEMWVASTDADSDQIIKKHVTFTPGLYKIYDEILVNAADNKQRDLSMDKIDITIDASTNTISVRNNGKGLPIEWHRTHECYVPSLVFGHLLTGSNFNDEDEKTTGGRNGYGAKLANIFSTKFKVDCADCTNGKIFSQTFEQNMTVSHDPKVKDMTESQRKKGDYVKITFCPDLEKFKMTQLDDDTVALLSKRAYDIAGSMAHCEGKKLSVSLNGKKLPVKKFEGYLSLYCGVEPPSAYEKVNERWEVGIGVTDGTFEQVSFVNAISTSKGGEHVNYIADQVAKRLATTIGKKNKGGVAVKSSQIKNYLSIFVNCLISNPSFDSQTKEFLTTKKSKFGSTCVLSEKFLKKVEKSGVVESILRFAKFKEKEALTKKGGTKKVKLTGITKLDDANYAGSAKSKDCTLILTEGDSAKSLAMSGLSVVGRDYYGVFPLKGKPLNVRDAAHSQITKNEEIKNFVDIMGLKFGVVYDSTNIKTLRYGHLMIMADQDHDGSHIKGLVINCIHHFWPSLLDIPGFLQQFITPIVKATKGKNQTKTFFTLPEYNAWKESTGNDAKGWHIKYYKGLGTSTSAEAKEYFSNLGQHEITFCNLSTDEVKASGSEADSDDDMEIVEGRNAVTGSDLITMAFSKKAVEDRKTWLNNLEKNTFLDYSEAQVEGMKFSDFINKELILFSQHDLHRSIPHVLDGFKPSQRKVLFGCFLRNLKNEMKVAQLSGYIGEKAAYHHGEQSLQGTIVGMAQDFVGSNNINLLTPSGQFGTRRMGGKDHASARYIFTKLEKITRTIFHPDDDALLTYLNDDGDTIEPEFYMPVIPLLLVNGADGIGTGWSTNIPNYNPREIIENLRRKINNEEMKEMHPHYFGYKGEIKTSDNTKRGSSSDSFSYDVVGKIERTSDETLLISELPVRKWTQDYKIMLEKMMTGDSKTSAKKKEAKEPEIKDFKENHTDTTVSFTVIASKEQIDAFEKEKGGLYGKFQLAAKLSTSNMNVFDQHGRIVKFANALKVIDHFFDERVKYYVKRKDHLLSNMRREEKMLSNKARFIEEVCIGELVVSNRKRTDILADLKSRGYELLPKQNEKGKQGESDNDDTEEDENDNSSDAELAKGYEYLLGMKIWSLTFEKAEKIREELAEKTKAVRELEATEPTSIWKNDLDAIVEALDDRDAFYVQAAKDELKAQEKNSKSKGGKGRKRTVTKKKPKKASSSDDSDDDFVVETKKKAPARKKQPAKKPVAITKKTAPKIQEKSTSAVAKESKGKKRASPRSAYYDSEELDSVDAREFEPAALDPAPKKAKSSKQASISLDSDSDEELAVCEQTDAPKTKAATKKATSKPKKATSKPKKATSKPKATKQTKKKVFGFDLDDFSSDDDEFDEEVFDEDSADEVEIAPQPPRARSGRAKKKVTYIDSDSEFED